MTARNCGAASDSNLEDLLTRMEKNGNFVPVGALDKRRPSKMALLRGLVRQGPFVAKNFELYFRNVWRRHVLHTKVVAPYAVTFYVTHKCNLDCSYCTQKEPEVFNSELPTAGTLKVLAKIRRDGFDCDHGRRADATGGHRDDCRGGAIQK